MNEQDRQTVVNTRRQVIELWDDLLTEAHYLDRVLGGDNLALSDAAALNGRITRELATVGATLERLEAQELRS